MGSAQRVGPAESDLRNAGRFGPDWRRMKSGTEWAQRAFYSAG
jgi:hypothetical protein